MQHIDGNAPDLYDFRRGQSAGPRGLVDVAADGGHGGDSSEVVENFRRADVSGVNDVFRPAQRCERFGAKQAVGVGDNAD